MFMLPSEKKRLYDEIDTLRTRVDALESYVRDLKMKDWWSKKLGDNKTTYGLKLDGTPKAKPGRKPKELNAMQDLEQLATEIVSNCGQEEFLKVVKKLKPILPKGLKELK